MRINDRSLFLSEYPPVKWEGIMDAVNRLPVDVAERYRSAQEGC